MTMFQPRSRYLTLGQVGARSGRHPELLRQWCAAGRVPCQRVGGSWMMCEDDLVLLDRMATRSHRPAAAPPLSGRRRLIAALFSDRDRVGAASDALHRRLGVDDAAIRSEPLGVRGLGDLGLTVLAGEVAEESVLDARRILSGFGGRIVAELDPPAPPQSAEPVPRRRAARVATGSRAR
ncbi:MAG: hypothetical protein H0V87_06040 [Chloroflexi bacterium]|nr:hypothetical protein [Chloroflexota bacterium]